MKKQYLGIFLVLFFLFPGIIGAKEGISHYLVDVTVQKNGDLDVRELFELEGEFNGYERIIQYANSMLPTFNGTKESFQGSSIYNSSGIVLKEIKAFPISGIPTLETMNEEGTLFNRAFIGKKGESGKYIETDQQGGKKIQIYNPSDNEKRGFYISYTLKNAVVKHTDVAELWTNLFSEEQREDIDTLEMWIHIPNNQEELRAWAHGPLWGNIKIVDTKTVYLEIENLKAGTAMDYRITFDVSSTLTNKESRVEALPSILEIEQKKADDANALREEARLKEKNIQMVGTVLSVIDVAWLLGLVCISFYIYKKYDKEYQSTFNQEYYRDFPAPYGPEIVGYLLHKTIGIDDLSASILNLIYKKAIGFDELEKKDYKLVRLESKDLTESEKKLLTWLFDKTKEVKLSTLKKEAKTSYEDFLKRHSEWKKEATKEGKSYAFYEGTESGKLKGIFYCLLGLLLGIGTISLEKPVIGILVIIASVIGIVYFGTFSKRSVKGNEDYHKWRALKKFMVDFGTMNEKDLPEIQLWEKYLVYAVSLGCADKLAKTMSIRVQEMENMNMTTGDLLWDFHRMNLLMSFNRSITTTMSNAYSSAIAASTESSGVGAGGGFSGGGGFGGGGGGGGRF